MVLGQPFVLENRPGAGGNLAMKAARVLPPTATMRPIAQTLDEAVQLLARETATEKRDRAIFL